MIKLARYIIAILLWWLLPIWVAITIISCYRLAAADVAPDPHGPWYPDKKEIPWPPKEPKPSPKPDPKAIIIGITLSLGIAGLGLWYKGRRSPPVGQPATAS